MKTSKSIIIAFILFVFSGILFLFLSGKYRPGEFFDDAELKKIENKLDDFSVIVATNRADIKVTEGIGNNKLTVHYKTSDSIPEMPVYSVRNDTLFIKKTPSNTRPAVHCKELKAVIIDNKSIVHVDKLPIDTIGIFVLSGKLYCMGNKQTEKVKQIRILANDRSSLQFNGMYIEEVELSLDHSTVNFQNTAISSLDGNLKNESKLMCYKPIGKIKLDVDMNSSYHLSKN